MALRRNHAKASITQPMCQQPEPASHQMNTQERSERYAHGYHAVIVDSYAQRSAETCAAFVLPRLASHHELLDLGCGPATITLGLARHVRRVVGVDKSAEMVQQARQAAAETASKAAGEAKSGGAGEAASGGAGEAGTLNVSFEIASAYELPFDDDSFDVVYAHQVMQHLADPVTALREARRVLRPGGLVALRDSDYDTMIHAPRDPAIERWRELYHQVSAANGGEADAGRFLLGWVLKAGFAEPTVTASVVTHATPEARQAWGQMWAVRALESDFAKHVTANGFADHEELQEISAAFRRWADSNDGFWAYLCGEVIAINPT